MTDAHDFLNRMYEKYSEEIENLKSIENKQLDLLLEAASNLSERNGDYTLKDLFLEANFLNYQGQLDDLNYQIALYIDEIGGGENHDN